jgi:hypothetical protein
MRRLFFNKIVVVWFFYYLFLSIYLYLFFVVDCSVFQCHWRKAKLWFHSFLNIFCGITNFSTPCSWRLAFKVARYHNCSDRLFLRDRKRGLNGFKWLESMHLLAPAGKVVLTPGIAVEYVALEVSQNHISCFGALCVRRNQNITNTLKKHFHLELLSCTANFWIVW